MDRDQRTRPEPDRSGRDHRGSTRTPSPYPGWAFAGGGLLQAGSGGEAAEMVIVGLVLGAMAFGIGVLVLLNWRDKKEGKHDEQASYQVQVDADDELMVVEAAHPEGRRHRLGGHGLIGVIEATSDRNDVRIHEVTLPDGREVDFEDYDRDEHGVPELLLAEDSRGLLEIRRDGRIRTRPPVDEAVREDIERILETALEQSTPSGLASPA